jgi:hypothetical protein
MRPTWRSWNAEGRAGAKSTGRRRTIQLRRQKDLKEIRSAKQERKKRIAKPSRSGWKKLKARYPRSNQFYDDLNLQKR